MSETLGNARSGTGGSRTGVHAYAWPDLVEIDRGTPGMVSVAVTNTSEVIDAYDLHVFGLDPDWLELAPNRLSLFPGETGNFNVTIKLPHDHPSSHRTLAIKVVSSEDPANFVLCQVELTIRPETTTTVAADPTVITSGRSATFGLVVANSGNAVAQAKAFAIDPEELAEITISPPMVMVPPGREQVVQVTVRGGRAWFGQARARTFTLGVEAERSVETTATWIQRPRIGRWFVSLLGLLTAAAVFAFVLSQSFDDVVRQASVNEDVLEEALASDSGNSAVVPANPLRVYGDVISGVDGSGIGGAQAELVVATNTDLVVASAATNDAGRYEFGALGTGEFLLRIGGEGIPAVWYPGVLDPADASVVEAQPPDSEDGPLDPIVIPGIPVDVSGQLDSDDPMAATVTIILPPSTGGDAPASGSGTADQAASGVQSTGDGTGTPEVATTGGVAGTVIGTAEIGPDGSFTISDVPSPGEYQLVIEQPGAAVQTRRIVLQPGESPEPLTTSSPAADGTITGRVLGPTGPLGGIEVTATSGSLEFTTVTLTEGSAEDIGTFSLRELPRPAQYVVRLSGEGYVTESRTISLDESTSSTDIDATSSNFFDVRLTPSVMSVSGNVLLGAEPARGITVRVTGGDIDRTKPVVSQGPAAGAYLFRDLPAPATYTLTFEGPGMLPQVRVVSLDPRGGQTTVSGVDASLTLETTTVSGTVTAFNAATDRIEPIGQATVTLTDGAQSFTFRTADTPAGQYRFANVPPGAYTLSATRPGSIAAVTIVNVTATELPPVVPLELGRQASITGLVVDAAGVPVTTPVTVRLFEANNFPRQEPLQTVTTGPDGRYRFEGLDAPVSYIVAVYEADNTANVLDSAEVRTDPSGEATPDPLRGVT